MMDSLGWQDVSRCGVSKRDGHPPVDYTLVLPDGLGTQKVTHQALPRRHDTFEVNLGVGSVAVFTVYRVLWKTDGSINVYLE
jgi:hypothetical protein